MGLLQNAMNGLLSRLFEKKTVKHPVTVTHYADDFEIIALNVYGKNSDEPITEYRHPHYEDRHSFFHFYSTKLKRVVYGRYRIVHTEGDGKSVWQLSVGLYLTELDDKHIYHYSYIFPPEVKPRKLNKQQRRLPIALLLETLDMTKPPEGITWYPYRSPRPKPDSHLS